MAHFKDVLNILFERWKLQHGGGSQDQFAAKHDVKRETINQWLTGKKRPPLSTVKRILLEEGFDIFDCFDLPEGDAVRAEQQRLYHDLNKIILTNDSDRLKALSFILRDMAAAAKPSRRPVLVESPKTEEAGNLLPNVKKKHIGKKPAAS